MGFPKIPGPEEIAAMVADAMAPMMQELTTIRQLLEEQNRLLGRAKAS